MDNVDLYLVQCLVVIKPNCTTPLYLLHFPIHGYPENMYERYLELYINCMKVHIKRHCIIILIKYPGYVYLSCNDIGHPARDHRQPLPNARLRFMRLGCATSRVLY